MKNRNFDIFYQSKYVKTDQLNLYINNNRITLNKLSIAKNKMKNRKYVQLYINLK